MGGKEEEARDLVGFLPDEAGGAVNDFNKIDSPLVEGAILEGKESEGEANEDGEESEGPLKNKNKIARIEEIGDEETSGQLEKLFERHVADEAELILGDVLGDGVLLHRPSLQHAAGIVQVV